LKDYKENYKKDLDELKKKFALSGGGGGLGPPQAKIE